MAKHAVEMTTSGSRGTEQGGRWAQEVAWAAGDGGWGGEEGAGQTLVHETHAPKRISHIQFGLLNAEVQEFRGGARERRRRRQLVVGVPSFQVSCCNNVLRFLAHVCSVVCFLLAPENARVSIYSIEDRLMNVSEVYQLLSFFLV